MNKLFTFANCLMLIFLFGEASSNSTEIQHESPPPFWHQLMQKNEIWNKKIEQMANEMDESDSFIEKLSNLNQNSTPNELKHSEKQSLFFNLLKLDNFYELVKGQKEMAKLVQNLAKTFITIKSLLIENRQIAITTILDKTENAMNLLAEQNEIVYKKAEPIELTEIVKSMATIWSEMSRINNGENAKEIVQKIVNLWQSAKQNDKFKKYFGNKSEGKNRRYKRLRVEVNSQLDQDEVVALIGIFLYICVFVTCCVVLCKHRN